MAAEDGENYMTTIGILNMRFNVIRTHQKLSFYSMPVASRAPVTGFSIYFYHHTHINIIRIEK